MSSIATGIVMIFVLVVFAWPRGRAYFSRPSQMILFLAFMATLLVMTIVIPEMERYGSGLSDTAIGSADQMP
jgi:hypothetical protein